MMMIQTHRLKMTWTATGGDGREFGTLVVTNRETKKEYVTLGVLLRNSQRMLKMSENILDVANESNRKGE